jgi:multidrug efflux pump subunit AcrA (membrane-fusion protein)
MLIVPPQAIFSIGGTDVVYVIGRGAPERRAVKIERRNADRVAIRAGLEPGEKVALEDPVLETRP